MTTSCLVILFMYHIDKNRYINTHVVLKYGFGYWGNIGGTSGACGGTCTGIGALCPLILMVWNTIVQLMCGIVVGIESCFVPNSCLCGAISGCGADALCPVWWCSQPLCACGSCSALGTVWLKIFTFAGFTGAAWYIGFADVFLAVGLLALLVAGILYGYAIINESSKDSASKSPDGSSADAGFKEMKLTVYDSVETGQIKF